MSSQALREAAAFLLAQAEIADGKPLQAGFDMNDKSTWWPSMLAQFKNDALPHEWREWVSGMLPSEVGDNDPTPDWVTKFRTFTDAATREGWKDSDGDRFFLPNVKRKAGVGGWPTVWNEVMRLWFSPEGVKWRSDPLNINEGKVPSL